MLRLTEEGIKEIVSSYANFNYTTRERITNTLRQLKAKDIADLKAQVNKVAGSVLMGIDQKLPGWVEEATSSTLQLNEDTSASIVKVDILKECRKQLAQRYAIKTFSREISPIKNFIADDLYPSIMWEQLLPAGDPKRGEKSIKNRLRELKYKYTPYTLNKGMSISQGIPYVPIADRIAMLGYNFADIKANLKKIKEKEYAFFFIGLGGMCLNVVQNLQEILQEAKMKTLFKSLGITEFDTIAYHNLPRFNTAAYLEESNVVLNENDYLSEFSYIIQSQALNGYYPNNVSKELLKTSLLNLAELNHLSVNKARISSWKLTYTSEIENFVEEVLGRTQSNGKKIFFGSPEVGTRNLISSYCRKGENNSTFLCATHSDDTVSIVNNPTVEGTNLIVESYGTIILTKLNLNILKATIELINILANRDDLANGEKLLDHTFSGLQTTKYSYISEMFGTRQGVEI